MDFIYPDLHATPAAAVAAAKEQWSLDGLVHRVLIRDDAELTTGLLLDFPVTLLGQLADGSTPSTATGFPADADYPQLRLSGTGVQAVVTVSGADGVEVGYLRLRHDIADDGQGVLVETGAVHVHLHHLDVLGNNRTGHGILALGTTGTGPDYVTVEDVDVHAVSASLLGAQNPCGPSGVAFSGMIAVDTNPAVKNELRRVRVWDVFQGVDTHCEVGVWWVDNTTDGNAVSIDRHNATGYIGGFLLENCVLVGAGGAAIRDFDNPATVTWAAVNCDLGFAGRVWEAGGTLGYGGTAGSPRHAVAVDSGAKGTLLNCLVIGWGAEADHGGVGSVVAYPEGAAPVLRVRGVRYANAPWLDAVDELIVDGNNATVDAAAITGPLVADLDTSSGSKLDLTRTVGSALLAGGSTGTWQPHPTLTVTPPTADYHGRASTGHVGAFTGTVAGPPSTVRPPGGWTDSRFREPVAHSIPAHTPIGATKTATPDTAEVVLATASAGDVIVLEDGTYRPLIIDGVVGTEATPVVVAARNQHGAVISGTGGAAVVVVNSSWVHIVGISAVGEQRCVAVGWNSSDSPLLYGACDHVTFTGCRFDNAGYGDAVVVQSGSHPADTYDRASCTVDVRFVDCVVAGSGGCGYRLGVHPGESGTGGIGAVFDVLIRGGEITRTNGAAIDNRGAWNVVVEDVAVHDCTIPSSSKAAIVAHWWIAHPAATTQDWFVQTTRRCRVWGITGENGNGIWTGSPHTVIESNIVWDCTGAGVVSSDVNEIDDASGARVVAIHHNTITGCPRSIALHESPDVGLVPLVNVVQNNLLDVPIEQAAPDTITLVGTAQGTGPRPPAVSSEDGWVAPAGIQAGDLIVVVAMATGPVNDDLDLSAPAGTGWTTLIDLYTAADAAGDAKYRPRVAAWWKTAAGTESGEWLIPQGSATSTTNPAPYADHVPYAEGSAGVGVPVGGIIVLRNADPAMLRVRAEHGDSATAPRFGVPAGLTAASDGSIAFWLFGTNSSLGKPLVFPPSGWTPIPGGPLKSTLTDPEV